MGSSGIEVSAGVVAIVGAASRAGRERLRGSSPPRSTERTPTPPDTSRNRPAGAPLRPPVIDGIEELDPTGRIEELDFLESGPHDREPPGFEPDTSRNDRTQARRGPSI